MLSYCRFAYYDYSERWPTVGNGEDYVCTCIKLYRYMTMINNLNNIAFGKLIVPAWKLCCIITIPTTLYFLIKLNVFSPYATVLLLILLGSSLAIMVPSSVVMSKIFQISKSFNPNITSCLGSIWKTLKEERRKEYLAVAKSFPIMRCQVGGFYHMEANAKLTLLDTVINLLVFLLINF